MKPSNVDLGSFSAEGGIVFEVRKFFNFMNETLQEYIRLPDMSNTQFLKTSA